MRLEEQCRGRRTLLCCVKENHRGDLTGISKRAHLSSFRVREGRGEKPLPDLLADTVFQL